METGNAPSHVPVIPIASTLTIYDTEEIERKLAKLHGIDDNSLRELYNRMLNLGSDRYQVKPSRLPDMEAIYKELPNFHNPLDDIRRQLALCLDAKEGLDITPICLLGEPGVGKTHFAKKIADLLGTKMGMISLGQMTAGWLLSGSSAQWKNGKPGKVFENLVEGAYANPVLILDEIDKAGQETQYDPLGSLFTLLEHDTASAFVDEFADVPIDASKVIWVSTANDERFIPKPLLNRMNVHVIEKPTKEQAHTIARNLYAAIREEYSWGNGFDKVPSEDLLDTLADIGPREMRKALMIGFGNAKLEKKEKVEPSHLPSGRNKKTSIGFMN